MVIDNLTITYKTIYAFFAPPVAGIGVSRYGWLHEIPFDQRRRNRRPRPETAG